MSYQSKYFSVREWECKCGCGLSNFSEDALRALDKIRETYGKPMRVNSGCRCRSHNDSVGGSANSAHLPQSDGKCYAVDIACTDSQDRFWLMSAALKLGCQRIGLHKSFIHMDWALNLPKPVIWFY